MTAPARNTTPRPRPNPAAPRLSPGMIATLVCIGVLLVCGAVYAPTLTAGFIAPDDTHYVDDVGRIWRFEKHTVWRLFNTLHHPENTAGYYQPLTALSLMLDAWLTVQTASVQARAFHFHLTNIVLHLACVAVVFILVRRFSGSVLWATLFALLFGLHPAQVPAVAVVAERMTLLGGLFALISLAAYLRYARTRAWRWLHLAALLYLCAVLSKPAYLGLPILFLVLDVWPLRRLTWRPIVEKIPLFILVIALAALQYRVQAHFAPARAAVPGGVDLFATNLLHMLQRLVAPVGLDPFYPYDAAVTLPVPFELSVVIALLVLLYWALFRWPPFFVALAGVIVLIVPALRQAPYARFILGDAYLYTALVVPLLVVAAWLGRHNDTLRRPHSVAGETPALPNHNDTLRRAPGRVAALALAGVACWFGAQSYERTFAWQSNIALYKHTVDTYPQHIFGYRGLVDAHIADNDLNAALYYAEKAVQLDENDPTALFSLGRVLVLHEDGRAREAITPLRRALQSNPEWIDCLYYLGVALNRAGNAAEAAKYLERARDMRPHSHSIHLALGDAYLDLDRPASARRAFGRAMELRTTSQAHLGLAAAWAANDMPDLARRHLAAALTRDPTSAQRALQSKQLRGFLDEPAFRALVDELSTESAAAATPGTVDS